MQYKHVNSRKFLKFRQHTDHNACEQVVAVCAVDAELGFEAAVAHAELVVAVHQCHALGDGFGAQQPAQGLR